MNGRQSKSQKILVIVLWISKRHNLLRLTGSGPIKDNGKLPVIRQRHALVGRFRQGEKSGPGFSLCTIIDVLVISKDNRTMKDLTPAFDPSF